MECVLEELPTPTVAKVVGKVCASALAPKTADIASVHADARQEFATIAPTLDERRVSVTSDCFLLT
jgi:hypothetical protein